MPQLLALPGSVEAVDSILRIHTREHHDSVAELPVTGEAARLAVSGSLTAVKAVVEGKVRNAFCAIRPPGHHANNNTGSRDGFAQGEGFCFYSNAAIAARYAQDVLGLKRVLIADWDYHHGNGTENAFYDDPSVLFFSTHDKDSYPRTGSPERKGKDAGEGYNINVHLPCGATDSDILRAFEDELMPKAEAFAPELIILSAGFDSRMDDPLGCFEITDDGFYRLTRLMMQLADTHCQGRVVSLLEGGYNPEGMALAVEAHVRALTEG